ncbi:MAG: response regulator [Candidatus Omnitrophica bacterium]|nr:response regulator [Candidatus Omnitrophota bacterium]
MTNKTPSKILIVDDQKTNRNLLHAILTNGDEGFTVLQADSGRGALEALEASAPDIILLDVMMPDMGGYEVCRKIKAHEKYRDIPIIFITAKNKTEDMIQCFSLGAADYIVKPINSHEVKARVKAHLRIKKAEEERRQITNLEAVKNMVVTYNHNMNQPLMAAVTYLEVLLAQSTQEDKHHASLLKIKNELGKISVILQKIQALQELKSVDYAGNIKMIELE